MEALQESRPAAVQPDAVARPAPGCRRTVWLWLGQPRSTGSSSGALNLLRRMDHAPRVATVRTAPVNSTRRIKRITSTSTLLPLFLILVRHCIPSNRHPIESPRLNDSSLSVVSLHCERRALDRHRRLWLRSASSTSQPHRPGDRSSESRSQSQWSSSWVSRATTHGTAGVKLNIGRPSTARNTPGGRITTRPTNRRETGGNLPRR